MKAITLQQFYKNKSKGKPNYKKELKEKQKINSYVTFKNNIKPGEIIVIASKPGEGKTNFLHNLLINQVFEKNEKVFLFSIRNDIESNYADLLEISEKLKVEKIIDFNKILINETQVHSTEKATGLIMDTLFENADIKGIYIDDIHELSWFFHLYEREEEDYYNISEDIGNCDDLGVFFRFITSVSLKYQIPIFITAEVKKACEYKSDYNRPIISDIKIERLAYFSSKLVFVYRPTYYGLMEDEFGNSNKGLLELIIVKNKNGDSEKTIRMIAYDKIVKDF